MSQVPENTPKDEMTVGEHLGELRSRIVRSVIALVLIAIVLFIYKGVVVDVIFAPMQPDFPTNRFFDWLATMVNVDALRINQNPVEIINTRMAGQFGLHIKSSLIGAVIFAFPYIVWQLWLFIRPALSEKVKMQSRQVVFQVSMFFFIGLAFGYYMIAPLAVNFLTGYVVSDTITNMIDVSSYISTVMGVSFAAGLIFQLPVLVRLLATIGIMKASLMRKYRKVAFMILLIVAAIITPPDVFSQVLIMIPLYGLYEYGIVIADRIERRKAIAESIDLE